MGYFNTVDSVVVVIVNVLYGKQIIDLKVVVTVLISIYVECSVVVVVL